MRTALRELQYALRRLRNTPGFTIAATLTLAIAIGATASVFSVVDGVLLKSTGIRDPRRLLVVSQTNSKRHISQWPTSPANYLDWQAQSTVFSGLAASELAYVTVTGTQEPERVRDLIVTTNWFSALGLSPALGRTFTSDSSGPAEALISYGYWQRKFGGERSVLGRTLIFDGKPYTIVGVMRSGRAWPSRPKSWPSAGPAMSSFTADSGTV
jgi:putative ABC transport system permease protein